MPWIRTPNLSRLAAALALAAATAAQASPVVAIGSHYEVMTHGGLSGTFRMQGLTFDGRAEQFTRDYFGTAMHYTVNEQQIDLGGGHWKILVTIASDSNLFPVDDGREFGGMRLGTDPLDLLMTLRLDQAFLTATLADGSEVGGVDWVAAHRSSFDDLDHWDGCFLRCGTSGVYGSLGTYDTRMLTLDLRVSDPTAQGLPEPSPLALLLVAGIAAAWRARSAAKPRAAA